jgi:hypothetical protein
MVVSTATTATATWATAAPTSAASTTAIAATISAPLPTITAAVRTSVATAARWIVAGGVVTGGKILRRRSVRFWLTLIEIGNFRLVRLLRGSIGGFFALAKSRGAILVVVRMLFHGRVTTMFLVSGHVIVNTGGGQ